MEYPPISLLLPIRNESAYIERCLRAVLAQDYPPDRMEILVVDGMSTDGTREIVRKMIAQSLLSSTDRQPPVVLLDNLAGIVPTALNIGLRQAKGEIIIRVDGHTVIAPDYVHRCVEALEQSGADNVGGRMHARGENAWGVAVAAATSSPFGVGGARFHYSDEEEWVDTVYMGAWPRPVFWGIGLFDEELVRDQDDEFNYRLREYGGRILLSPKIKSVYLVRGTPQALWRQYYQYGFWKVRVLQKHPLQMRPRQFVPPLFVLSLLASAFLAITSIFPHLTEHWLLNTEHRPLNTEHYSLLTSHWHLSPRQPHRLPLDRHQQGSRCSLLPALCSLLSTPSPSGLRHLAPQLRTGLSSRSRQILESLGR